jgi:hypothetical protein
MRLPTHGTDQPNVCLMDTDISIQVEAIMATKAPTPDIKGLVFEYLSVFVDFAMIIHQGLVPACKYMWNHPSSIFSIATWQSQLAGAALPWLMSMADQTWGSTKTEILQSAQGVVLEVGAGTGETLRHYPSSQIRRIYGIEPSLQKCALLQQKVEELGMRDKYCVIPRGIGNCKDEITYGSIDTVVCVSCFGTMLIRDTLSLQYS